LNMWCLWSLGRLAERLMGRAALAVAYVASGLAGSVASLLWNPMIISAGASGAVFGVAGTLLSFLSLKKEAVDPALLKKELSSLGVFIFYNLSHGFQHGGIDNSAHIGGLVMGMAIGALLPRAIAATGVAYPSPTAIAEAGRESHPGSRITFLACAAAVVIVGGTGLARRTQSAAVDLAAGQELLDAGKPALAIDKLKRVIASNPDFAPGQYMLGTAYIQADRPAEAIAPLRTAVSLAPDDADIQHNLAIAYLATQNYDQAIAWFLKVMPKESNDARARFGLGSAYFGKQLFDKAIVEEKAALNLDPDSTPASRILADAYLQKGQVDDAIATYEGVPARHPEDRETADTLARVKALKSAKAH